MTNEEKELLLKDLCTRLPYGVKCLTFDGQVAITGKLCSCDELTDGSILFGLTDKTYDAPDKYYMPQAMYKYDTIKPYLRPMSSMTEEENTRRCAFLDDIEGGIEDAIPNYIDWLNSHHFDYHNLIEKGLALEAPEGMYD